MTDTIESLRAEVARLKSDRRERIATAALAGLLSVQSGRPRWTVSQYAVDAVHLADALIAELDKEPSR